jgi:hypothetical protein
MNCAADSPPDLDPAADANAGATRSTPPQRESEPALAPKIEA